jgi:hypothetical protein
MGLNIRPVDATGGGEVADRLKDAGYLLSLADQVEAINFDKSLLFPTGIRAIDDRLGGGYEPGGTHIISGYSSNGKSLLLANIIGNNRDKRVIYFSPDDTLRLLIPKFYKLVNGTACRSSKLLAEFVRSELPWLYLDCSNPCSVAHMEKVYKQCCQTWGEKPEAIVFDYATQLTGIGDRIEQKIGFFKGQAETTKIPFIIAHQNNRPGGKPGISMENVQFGGEREATTLIGVWRRINFQEELAMSEAEILFEETNPTVNIVVAKNKQEQAVTGPMGIQYEIDPSGFLFPSSGPPVPKVVTGSKPMTENKPLSQHEAITAMFGRTQSSE